MSRTPSRVLLGIVGTLVAVGGTWSVYDTLEYRWYMKAYRTGLEQGRRMAEADAARGRLDAGYYPGLVWVDCHMIPMRYIPEEEVAEDPERAYSCAVNQWRNCVAENILKEQYGAKHYPSGRDFFLGSEEEGHLAGYDREMRRLAEERFRAELEPLRQGLIARRVEHAACGDERRQVAAVESLVTRSRGAETAGPR